MKWPWDNGELRSAIYALRSEMERHHADALRDLVAREQKTKLLPSDLVTRCPNPDCAAPERPKKVLLELHDVVLRDGKMEALPAGYRMACQPCGHVFSADRLGVYRQHPSALPFMPTLGQPKAQETGEDGKKREPARMGLPPPREPLMP